MKKLALFPPVKKGEPSLWVMKNNYSDYINYAFYLQRDHTKPKFEIQDDAHQSIRGFRWPDFFEMQNPDLSGKIGTIDYEKHGVSAVTFSYNPKGIKSADNPFLAFKRLGYYLEAISTHDLIINEKVTSIRTTCAASWDRIFQVQNVSLKTNTLIDANLWFKRLMHGVASAARNFGLHPDAGWDIALVEKPRKLPLKRAQDGFERALRATGFGKQLRSDEQDVRKAYLTWVWGDYGYLMFSNQSQELSDNSNLNRRIDTYQRCNEDEWVSRSFRAPFLPIDKTQNVLNSLYFMTTGDSFSASVSSDYGRRMPVEPDIQVFRIPILFSDSAIALENALEVNALERTAVGLAPAQFIEYSFTCGDILVHVAMPKQEEEKF